MILQFGLWSELRDARIGRPGAEQGWGKEEQTVRLRLTKFHYCSVPGGPGLPSPAREVGGLLHECELSRKNPQFRKTQFFEIRNWPQRRSVELAQKKRFWGKFRTAGAVGSAGSSRQFTRNLMNWNRIILRRRKGFLFFQKGLQLG